MSWKAKTPSLVVVVLSVTSVPTFVAFTPALATTAPDWSVTVPLMAPRKVWLKPATAKKDRTTRIAITRRIVALHRELLADTLQPL
jgi:hypothetical protein